jgi:hypothetical protein
MINPAVLDLTFVFDYFNATYNFNIDCIPRLANLSNLNTGFIVYFKGQNGFRISSAGRKHYVMIFGVQRISKWYPTDMETAMEMIFHEAKAVCRE